MSNNQIVEFEKLEPKTLLLVDDTVENALLLEVYLKKCPYKLLIAENGVQAVDLFRRNKVDVVLMDIDMPVLDGIKAVDSASELYPNTKFVMLTVFDDDVKIFDAIRAGAVGYLLKDESADRIVNAIQEIMVSGGAPMSPRIARKALQIMVQGKFVDAGKTDSGLSDRELEILKGLGIS